MDFTLLDKYNVPAPRYTSYPTVPYWQEETAPGEKAWQQHVINAVNRNREISLYVHLPYCESLCTYCGCNKRITKNHQVESSYIDSVLREWSLYLQLFPERPVLRELHLGGGTPTFFSPANLERLVQGILKRVELPKQYEFGFEAHPGSTTHEHLRVLRELGFRRLSIGVQDFAPEILEIINRHQSLEQVQEVTQWARDLGYRSINYDLIFGLPLQTKEHIRKTVSTLESLRPERIAFYSYAHVPWIKPSQRAYSEADLPRGKEKRALYELGRELLEASGYIEIGMDHFALPHDSLYQAMENGTLHRNFMGYTPFFTRLSIALGASGISDSWDAYIQNEKQIETYRERVGRGELPIMRGHRLSEEDEILRTHILRLMCRFHTQWADPAEQCPALFEGLERMEELESDGLVTRYDKRVEVTERGRPFLRNICMALDGRYWRRQPEGKLFSQVV